MSTILLHFAVMGSKFQAVNPQNSFFPMFGDSDIYMLIYTYVSAIS